MGDKEPRAYVLQVADDLPQVEHETVVVRSNYKYSYTFLDQ